ncbi:MAG: RHS repeat-associated core domain-containing protein [Pyrinomonadaceae bacterium]
MNYTIPLLGIGGRGEVGYTISLSVNQQWILEHRHDEFIDENGHGIYNDHNVASRDPWWSPEELRYMPGKLIGRSSLEGNFDDPLCPPSQSQNTLYATTQLSFVTADGSEINLVSRIHGASSLPVTVQCSQSGDPTAIYPSSRGTEFVSNDGSAVRFNSDQIVTDGQFSGGYFLTSGYLYLSNGTQYRIDIGRVSWMKDRNGNRMTFTYDGTNYDSKLIEVTDSNGRVVDISYNNQDSIYGLHDRVRYTGFDQQSQAIRISYAPLASALRAGETLKSSVQLFGDLGCPTGVQNCPDPAPINPQVVASVWFPGDRQFRYKYNSYGELARVETPTGSAFEYDWGGSLEGGPDTGVLQSFGYFGAYPEISRQVLEKRVYPSGGNGSSYEIRTTISKSIAPTSIDPVSTRTIKTLNNGNNLLARQTHHFYGSSAGSSIFSTTALGVLEGREYEANYFGSDDSTLLARELKGWTSVSLVGLPSDVRLSKQVAVILESGNALASLTEVEYNGNGIGDFEYFSHLNKKSSKAYHYKTLTLSAAQSGTVESIGSLFTAGDLAAVSETDYSYDPGYKARGILGRPIETRSLNPTDLEEVLAKSQFVYDEAAYFDNSYTTTNWENPNSNLRGNVTTTRTWKQETGTWIESHSMFDNFGNVRKIWDTSGDATRFIETEYDPIYKYAYPTKTKAPAPDPTGVYGTTQGSEISRTYDFNTGLLLTVTDANGQTATTEYDARLRVKKITPPPGGSVSEFAYNDVPNTSSAPDSTWVKSRQQIDGNNWAETTTFYDNIGRVRKTRTKDLQGDVMSQVKYDSFGRVEKTSNPYRVNAAGEPTETVYWSKLRYDHQSRVVETYAPAPEGQTGISLGTVQFGISDLTGLIGTYVVATDASGRKSRAISGIYGLMRVDEATAKGGSAEQDLGTLANPTQPTFYSYNVKGELVKIAQGGQNRFFMYDSLGRLIKVRQPEQTPNSNLATTGNPDNNEWTAAYTYDDFGNVLSVTDAKNITITNLYDKASRPVKRTYSDGTPQVEFFYDGKGLPSTPAFSRGALTKVTSTVSEDRFTSFDNHGRLLASEQITDGQTYGFTYKYNLSGGLIEQTYPSGRLVRNFLDSDGGLSAVATKTATGMMNPLASDFDYSATGAVRKMKLGNGLWETAVFDELNQLKQVGLGTSQTNNDLFKIDYEYGELNADGVTVDTAKNIGMIAKTTTTIPTTSFVQTFKYDAINRLTEAVEKTGTTQNWVQTFGYDRYGNRTQFSQTVGSTQLPINNLTHPTIDQTNNRFTTGQGYVYDFNGNLILDAQNRSFVFNGDDKQTEIRDLNVQPPPENPDANVIGRYSYDGSGARVKKVTATETTIFVYDAGGALAAEYSTVVAPAEEAETSYLTTDHLGSPRVITDASGQVIARRDFMPFGEEIGVGVGARSESLKYSVAGTDRVRKRFTGYEKDDETGLDFAEARMYQNRHGRFTAPDPLLASASAVNPQTFNRYIYTGNDPVNYADPSGLSWCRSNSGATTFTGVGKPCPTDTEKDKWANVDGEAVTLSGGDWSDVGGQVGDYGTLNRNGSFTPLVPASRSADLAPEKGVQVRAEQEAISSAPAAEISSNIAPRGALPLPCESCGGGSPLWSNTLADAAAAAPGLQTVEDIKDAARLLQLVPGANVAATAVVILVTSGQANGGEALSELPNLIPGVKWFRKADKAMDSISALKNAGFKDAHHTIQHAAVKNLPGYSKNAAPGVHLPGPPNLAGTPHNIATSVQRQRGGGTYGAERRIGYKALRKAGLSRSEARNAINKADAYFGGLGVNKTTPTRIPGNRR